MSQYTIEVQVNTAQGILMLTSGQAKEFVIKEYTFRLAELDLDDRPGLRYFVERQIEAESKNEAYDIFMQRLMKITDAIAYFYSQPVNVEYWNILIKKEGDEVAYFGAHTLKPTTSMTDYNEIDSRLENLIDKSEENEELQNSLWLYNNVATVDSVDYDPSSIQFGLCQLVESLSEKTETKQCEVCHQGGYKRTSHADMKALLGDDLHKKLYGKDGLRNRLGHGQLVGGGFLTHQDTEEAILKITERLNSKYGVWNKVSPNMTDKIRGTNVWNGKFYGIEHKSMRLEECLKIEFSEELHHTQKHLVTRGW